MPLPELLDGSKSAKMRRSSAVDVYAAASVLYKLLYACLPFERFEDELSIGEAKRTKRPAFGASAHRVAEDVSVVLAREPEIAVAVGMESSQMSVRPHAEDVRTALSSIDAQLEAVVEPSLSVDPKDRPCPAAARDACGAFAFRYAGNIRHALRGEPLDSCVSGGPASGFAGSPLRIRNLLRSVGKAASAAVWSVSVVATGLLVHGVDASWALGPCSWFGSLNGCAVSAALAVPALAGFAIRGKRSHTLRGFLFGSVALLSMACLVFLLGSMLELPSDEVFRGLAAALFAVVAAGWCPLVLDYALAVLPFRPRKALFRRAVGRHPSTRLMRRRATTMRSRYKAVFWRIIRLQRVFCPKRVIAERRCAMVTNDKTPCAVLFETLKKHGDISNKELASLVLSGGPFPTGAVP